MAIFLIDVAQGKIF